MDIEFDMEFDADEFEKNLLQALEEELDLRINDTNDVPLQEVFPEEFMRLYTDFESIEEFFAASPWDVTNQADLETVPDDPFDAYVDEHTDFPSSEVMAQTGWQRLLEKRLQ